MGPIRVSYALTAILAVAALAVVLESHSQVARIVSGLLLALLLPVYAVSCVVLRREREPSERATLAIGLSLSIAAVAGVVLDRTPWGLTERSWAIALAGVTLAASAAAAATTASPGTRREGWAGLRPGLVACLTAAVLVGAAAAGAVALARKPAGASRADGYTVLWISPTTGRPRRFEVGVASQELAAARYRLVGTARGRVLFARRLALAPGEDWSMNGIVRGALPARLIVRLYLSSRATVPYRRVTLTLKRALAS